jgi:hypothetical protein
MGAMARLWDWLLKRQAVATNPFRLLRKGYASGVKKDIESVLQNARNPDEQARIIGDVTSETLRN